MYEVEAGVNVCGATQQTGTEVRLWSVEVGGSIFEAVLACRKRLWFSCSKRGASGGSLNGISRRRWDAGWGEMGTLPEVSLTGHNLWEWNLWAGWGGLGVPYW